MCVCLHINIYIYGFCTYYISHLGLFFVCSVCVFSLSLSSCSYCARCRSTFSFQLLFYYHTHAFFFFFFSMFKQKKICVCVYFSLGSFFFCSFVLTIIILTYINKSSSQPVYRLFLLIQIREKNEHFLDHDEQ